MHQHPFWNWQSSKEKYTKILLKLLCPMAMDKHDFLDIIMPDALYLQQTLCSANWSGKIPLWHSSQYIHPTMKQTTHLLQRTQTGLWCLQSSDKYLYNQFQETIHENYLMELRYLDIGLTNIHPGFIYQHIVDWYAKINLKMVEKDQKTFSEPMDPTKVLLVYTKK